MTTYVRGVSSPSMRNVPTLPDVGVIASFSMSPLVTVTVTLPSGWPSLLRTVPAMLPSAAPSLTVLSTVSAPPSSTCVNCCGANPSASMVKRYVPGVRRSVNSI